MSDNERAPDDQHDLPHQSESFENIQAKYGTQNLSDRTNVRIEIALREALRKEKVINGDIEQLLRRLDETQEDELLGIDFTQMKNQFKQLEQKVLKDFRFRLPSVWTKKYADYMVNSPPSREQVVGEFHNVWQPVYSILEVKGKTKLQESGVRLQPQLRQTRSEICIASSYDDIVSPKKGNSDQLHTQENRQEQYYSASSSRHYNEKTSLSALKSWLVYESISDSNAVHFASNRQSQHAVVNCALDNLNLIAKEVTQEVKADIPTIAGVVKSASKERISQGVQVGKIQKTSFQTYLELKKRMKHEKLLKSQNDSLKSWAKVSFLQNIPLEEYMRHKRQQGSTWHTNNNRDQGTDKAYKQNIPLIRKQKDYELRQPPAMNAGTIAMAPDHSTSHLAATPSNEIFNIKKSLKLKGSEHSKNTKLRKSGKCQPALPHPMISSDDLYQLPVLSTAKVSTEDIRHSHDSCEKQVCSLNVRNSVNRIRESLSQNVFRESFHSNIAQKSDSKGGLTMDHILQGASNRFSNQMVKLNSIQSTRQVANVVNHQYAQKFSKRLCTSPNTSSPPIAPRRYVTELVIGKRQFDLGKTCDVFGYQNMEFGRELHRPGFHNDAADLHMGLFGKDTLSSRSNISNTQALPTSQDDQKRAKYRLKYPIVAQGMPESYLTGPYSLQSTTTHIRDAAKRQCPKLNYTHRYLSLPQTPTEESENANQRQLDSGNRLKDGYTKRQTKDNDG